MKPEIVDSEELRLILKEAIEDKTLYLPDIFNLIKCCEFFTYSTGIMRFDKIEKLDSELATLLSPLRRQLSLRNVSKMDLDTLQKLMEVEVAKGSLDHKKRVLPCLEIGLEEIDPITAKILNKTGSYLSLPNLKKIDPDSAWNLRGIAWGLLLGLETIDPETASALVENLPKTSMSRNLILPNLKSCDRESLKILSQVLFAPGKNPSWYIRPEVVFGFEEIDTETVALLSAEEGAQEREGFISGTCPYLKRGTVDVFQAMADSWKRTNNTNWLCFNSLESINAAEAKALVSGVFGALLSLNGLKNLEQGVAEQLSKLKPHKKSIGYESPTLSLNGLVSITKEDAMHLASLRKFGELHLSGVKFIDESIASELAKFSGSIYLDGLSSISDDAAKEISRLGHTCHESCDPSDRWWLQLDGITKLSDVAAKHLSTFEGSDLLLRGLKDLSILGQESFSNYKGCLHMKKKLWVAIIKIKNQRLSSNANV
jgi:hypothetical protein